MKLKIKTQKMRNKIRQWLIDLANKIGDKDFYDFGEPITHVAIFGKHLIVSTKHSVYGTIGLDKKWAKFKASSTSK